VADTAEEPRLPEGLAGCAAAQASHRSLPVLLACDTSNQLESYAGRDHWYELLMHSKMSGSYKHACMASRLMMMTMVMAMPMPPT
jgi:hypothetical protein